LQDYIVKTKKAGDQIVVALPKELLQAQQIDVGMLVRITVQKCERQDFGDSKKDCSLGPEDPWGLLE
jgi:hypothetical protein